MRPVGVVRSCFGDKFAVPRQPGLVPEATATLVMDPAQVVPEALRGLDAFSHVWVIFGFHAARDVRMTVRPPRLAAARRDGVEVGARVGVYATRSPHRPNHLGLSAVRLVAVRGLEVDVAGVDLLDGSPVWDVKPYLPYADAIPDASGGWATGALPRLPVAFSAEAEAATDAPTRALIEGALALDPRRPGAREGSYAFRLHDRDVRCRIEGGRWTVEALVAPRGTDAG